MKKQERISNGQKTVYSTNGVGKTREEYAKNESRPLSYTILHLHLTFYYIILQKNSKWMINLNMRPETIKPLKENISSNLLDVVSLDNIFLDMSPQARVT